MQGFWLYLAFHLLYNARALYYTMHYVVAAGDDSYANVLHRFSSTLQEDRSALGQFCRSVIVDRSPSLDGATYGLLLEQVLYSRREEFSQLLAGFCSRQPWWSDSRARTLFQLDCLARPFPYANQSLPGSSDSILVATKERTFIVSLPPEVYLWLRKNLEVGALVESGDALVAIDHDRGQLPRMSRKSPEQQGYYLQSLLDDLRSVVPRIVSRNRGESASKNA
jgi:hypothetical protein